MTAAAVGAITGAVIVLAKRSIIDLPTMILALTTVIPYVAIQKAAGARDYSRRHWTDCIPVAASLKREAGS